MNVRFPIAGSAEALWAATDTPTHGLFPVGSNHFWHGGVHLRPALNEAIRCVADGEIVAYRLDSALKDYEVPVPGAAAEAPKKQYSSGFVLVRHKLTTPKKQDIVFYSLYMHLAPVPEAETKKDDLDEHPFVFKQTHAVVCGDDDGGGMPIFGDRADEATGVVPFTATFQVLADDEKCKNQRYRKVRTFKPIVGYAPFVDGGEAFLAPHAHTRVRSGPTLDLQGEDKSVLPQKLATGAFFLVEDPAKGHWAKKWHYERVVAFDGEKTSGIARVSKGKKPFHAVDGCDYFEVTESVTFFTADGAPLAAIAKDAIVKKKKLEKTPDWTKDATHKETGAEFLHVDVYGVARRGYGLIEGGKSGAEITAPKNVDLIDESQAAAGRIEAGKKLLVLGRPDVKGHFIYRAQMWKVSVYDLDKKDGEEGYAFVRSDMSTTLPRPAGTEARELRLWGVADHTAVPDSPILPEADPDGAVKPPQLKGTTVFEALPDAEVDKDHWSKSTGWRKIRWKQPALMQGRQPELVREGYAFVGAHVEHVKDDLYRVSSAEDVAALGLDKHPNQSIPRTVAVSYSSGKRWGKLADQVEKLVRPHTRAHDGLYNGVNVRKEGKKDAELVGVLGVGAIVQFEDKVPWKLSKGADDKPVYTTTKGYYKLKGGGHTFVSASAREVVKRPQIPDDELKHDRVVELKVPVPIRRGDVVGYAGRYLDDPAILHFEIFTTDKGFTDNPKGDTWGEKVVDVDGDAAWVRAPAENPSHALPERSTYRVLARRGEWAHVELLTVEGWMKVEDVEDKDPRKLKQIVKHLAAEAVSKGKDKAGVEHFVLSDKKWPIVGAAGDLVQVLETKGEVCRVKTTLGELTGGWIRQTEVHASAKELREELGTYRYALKASATAYRDDPNEAFQFRLPADADKPGITATQTSLKDADTKKVRVPLKQIATGWGHEATVDDKGKVTLGAVATWKGVKTSEGATPAYWVKASQATTLSKPYDWKVEWTFLEEPGEFSDDGFCDVAALLKLVDDDPETHATAEKVDGKAAAAAVAKAKAEREALLRKLRKTACKHPTEWDSTDNEKKYKRLQGAPWNMVDKDGKPDERFKKTLEHIKALQFWKDVKALPDGKSVWHFHPVGFLAHLKTLGLVTRAELVAIAGEPKGSKIDEYLVAMNDTLEAYGAVTPRQLAHFFSQVVWETGFFTASTEGAPFDYTGMLGNTLEVDAKRFIGRGLVQTTGRGNYEEYERFKGEDFTSTDAAAGKLATLPYAVDSAGFYYNHHVYKDQALDVTRTVQEWAETGDESAVRHVTLGINGGFNDMGARRMLFDRAKRVFFPGGDGS